MVLRLGIDGVKCLPVGFPLRKLELGQHQFVVPLVPLVPLVRSGLSAEVAEGPASLESMAEDSKEQKVDLVNRIRKNSFEFTPVG